MQSIKLQYRYWWLQMATTVTQYVQGWQICQAYNRPTTRNVGKMCFMPTTEVPFTAVAMDHITMLLLNSRSNIVNVIYFAMHSIAPGAVSTTSRKHFSSCIPYSIAMGSKMTVCQSKAMLSIPRNLSAF